MIKHSNKKGGAVLWLISCLKKKPFELPPANQDNRRVFAYLLKHRHLDREVLTTFVRLGLIYEDQKYHNAVFVGMDKDGRPRHAHKRSTNGLDLMLSSDPRPDKKEMPPMASRATAATIRMMNCCGMVHLPVHDNSGEAGPGERTGGERAGARAERLE
jgi:hypothetical protein